MSIKDPAKPSVRPKIVPRKLSARPPVVRPALASPRPSGAPHRNTQPTRYGIPDWQHGIIKIQNLLAAGHRLRVQERVHAATSGGTPSSTARSSAWDTRRKKYGASGRKS